MIQRFRAVLGVGVVTILLAGCQDLLVNNHNSPDRYRAMTDAGDVEGSNVVGA